MCIACGGVCGGAGDVVLPSLVIGAGLVVLGVRAKRAAASRKSGDSSGKGESSRPLADPRHPTAEE